MTHAPLAPTHRAPSRALLACAAPLLLAAAALQPHAAAQGVTLVPLATAGDTSPGTPILSVDGTVLFLAHHGSETLTRVEVGTGAVTGRLELTSAPDVMALDEAGTRLFVKLSDRRILEVDTVAWSVTRTMVNAPSATFSLTVQDGAGVLYASGGQVGRIYDLSTGALTQGIAFPSSGGFQSVSERSFLSADGLEVIVYTKASNAGPYFVSAFDAANGALVRTLPLPGPEPYGFLASRDRSQFLVQTGSPGGQIVERFDAATFASLGATTLVGGLFSELEAFDATTLRVAGTTPGGRQAFSLAGSTVDPNDPSLVQIPVASPYAFAPSAEWLVRLGGGGFVLTDLLAGTETTAPFSVSGVALSRLAFSRDETRVAGVDASDDWYGVFERTPAGFQTIASGSTNSIPGLSRADAFTLVPDAARAIAFGRTSAVAAVVDLDAAEVLAKVALGGEPTARVAVGDLAVAGLGDGTLLAIDPVAAAITGTASLGAGILELRAGAQPGEVWARVRSGAGDELVRVDTSSMQQLARIPLGASTTGTALHVPFVQGTFALAEGTGAAFAVRPSGAIDVVDLGASAVTSTIPAPSAPGAYRFSLTFDPVHARLFAGSNAPSITAFDASGPGAPTQLWHLAPTNSGAAIVSAEVALSGDGSVAFVDLTTNGSPAGVGLAALDAATGALLDSVAHQALYDLDVVGDALALGYIIEIGTLEFRAGAFSPLELRPVGGGSLISSVELDRDHGRVLAAKPDTTELVLVDLFDGRIQTACLGGTPNSIGEVARLAASGSPYAGDVLHLRNAGLAPGAMFGLLVVGPQLAAPLPVMNSQGSLCVSAPLGRFNAQVQTAGPDGAHAFEVDTTGLPVGAAPVPVTPGATWAFQVWYRDVLSGGAQTSNLSSALAVTFR